MAGVEKVEAINPAATVQATRPAERMDPAELKALVAKGYGQLLQGVSSGIVSTHLGTWGAPAGQQSCRPTSPRDARAGRVSCVAYPSWKVGGWVPTCAACELVAQSN